MAPVIATCPTCGASGDELCIRGRKPIDRGGIVGAVWQRGELLRDQYGELAYHDSRVTKSLRIAASSVSGPTDG